MNLLQHQMTSAEFARNVWHVHPEEGVTVEDMLDPKFWAHVAKSLKANDRIEVSPMTGSWYAELLVRGASDTEAAVGLLSWVEFDSAAPVSEEYEVRFRGRRRWGVLRKSDGVIVAEDLAIKKMAEDWVADQLLKAA